MEELDEDEFHRDDAHRDDRSSLLCDGSLDDRYRLVLQRQTRYSRSRDL